MNTRCCARRHCVRLLALFGVLDLTCAIANAALNLNPLFTDHMVLQRGIECPIWGKVDAGNTVEVVFDGNVVATGAADQSGAFKLKLPKLDASLTPHTLSVRSGSESKTLNDVLVGDVWLCSGQSNMQFALADVVNHDAEVPAASHPNLRLFYVDRVGSAVPLQTVKGAWQPCSPENAAGFSAVAYFFGRQLQNELNVPIGLIHSSWGGTPAEAWTPLPDLTTLTDLQSVRQQLAARALGASPEGRKKYEDDLYAYLTATGRLDEGPSGTFVGWADPKHSTADWKSLTVPGDWTRQGVPNGTVWLRRDIDVPSDLAGKDLTLDLGKIDEMDSTYFNGERVGQMSWREPQPWEILRHYRVPGKLVKAGRNVICVRIVDTGGAAGMAGPADAMHANIGQKVWSLSGEWQMKVEAPFEWRTNAAVAAPPLPTQPNHQNSPASLYNGMIYPLADFSIKGTIWYQGESNAGRYDEYERLMMALIGAWRGQFHVGDFPFYIVGLANFGQATNDPNRPSNWAGLREAQRMLGRHLTNVATTVTIDIGEGGDIHPRNKQDVGRRLALVALEQTYGKTLISRGPTLDRAEFNGPTVTLRFEHVGGGLKVNGAELESFTLAGEDGKFVDATARIEGDTVVVSAPGVSHPTRVRYAWADNPKASLFNQEGLPAEPFEASR